MSKTKYYDITIPLRDGMAVWPDDVPVKVAAYKSYEHDAANVTRLQLSTHAGTHVDAPLHFGHKGTVDAMPPDVLIGPCRVVTVRARNLIRAEHIKRAGLAGTKRVLFKTRNSRRAGGTKFHKDFVALSAEAATALVGLGVRLVGIDGPSIDPFNCDGAHTAHHTLLGAGIVVLENIDLTKVSAGRYGLICLPLKVAGADGAPARAMLRTS
jgi:arylformamidase